MNDETTYMDVEVDGRIQRRSVKISAKVKTPTGVVLASVETPVLLEGEQLIERLGMPPIIVTVRSK